MDLLRIVRLRPSGTAPFALRRALPALFVWALGCVPDLDTDEALVTEARVLAVIGEPAEPTPGQTVNYRALVADAQGVVEDAEINWFLCGATKPLAELGPINRKCLSRRSGELTSLGSGLSVSATVSFNICSSFGPNPPPPMPDEPPGRPADPDETGGYKFPVVLGHGKEIVLYEQRVLCGLAGAAPATASDFTRRYRPNANPAVEALRVQGASGDFQTIAEGEALEVAAGEELRIEVRWPSCPEEDVCGDGICGIDDDRSSCDEDCSPVVGCGGRERYLWLDPEERALKVRRESMRVAWFATGGTYEDERTGVDEDASRDRSDNRWTAPSRAGSYTLWTVLRDSRGGVGYRTQAVIVR